MQPPEFLVLASLCSIIFHRPAVGQNREVIPRSPAVAQDEKVTVNFGDLVIEVTPPRGREDIVNTQQIYEKWENFDDATYWEMIYGSMDDIPAFEDLPDIAGKTVELKYVNESEDEDSNRKPVEICSKNQSESSTKSSSDADYRGSASEGLNIARDSHPDRCERINPLYAVEKSWSRLKRDASESKEKKAEPKEVAKSGPNKKRKSRTTALLQNALGKSRFISNLRSDYLSSKYGRKGIRHNKHLRGSSAVDDCADDVGLASTAISQKFVDSAINAVKLVSSGIAKTGEAVASSIADAARQLAQAKRDVIDLGHEATEAIGLGSLNNAALDCQEGEAGAAVATSIDSGVEVVGNSVLDSKSGIINADTGASVGITASLGVEANADDCKEAVAAETVADAVVESKAELATDIAVQEEIAVAENEKAIDLQEAEVVGETLVAEEVVGDKTPIETLAAESNVAISAHGEVAVSSDTEASVGSALQLDAKVNAEASSGLKADIDTGICNKDDHARQVLGGQELSCECTALDDDRDREYYPRRRYYDEFEDESEYRRRFPGRSRYRPYSRDYYESHRPGIHGDVGVHSSLDAGIGAHSNVGSIGAGAAVSAGLDSNLDIGSSTGSGIRADAGVHASLDTNLGVGTDLRGRGLHGGTKSSLDVDTHLDIGRSRSNYRTYGYDRDRLLLHGNFDGPEGICDYDSEEYREYRRRFPDNRIRGHSLNSGVHADAGIHSSLDAGLGVNSNLGSISTGTAASLDVDSNLDIGTSNSGLRADSGIHTSLDADLAVGSRGGDHRIQGVFDGNGDICDCADYEEYLEYGRRFPGARERVYHGAHSGIHADAGFHKSLDAGLSVHSNHGSIRAGTKASLDLESNLDVGTSSSSGIHAGSGVHASLDAGLAVGSDLRAGGLRAGSKSSLDVDSHLDIGVSGSGNHGGSRIYGDFDRSQVVCECDDSEEYREYRRRFPGGRFRPDDRGFGVHGSGVHAGIHASLDAGVDVNSARHRGGISSGLHADAGVHSSLDTLDLDSRMSSRRPSGLYRGYERGEQAFPHYDDYDDEREYDGLVEGRYRDRHRGPHSGLHAAGGIHTSVDAEADINAGSAGLRAGAKSSLDIDSHLDVGAATTALNAANPLHLPGAINSAVHADAGIHTSLDAGLGTNAAGGLHAGIASSLDLDSHLDIGARTNGAPRPDGRSRIEVDVNGPGGKLGEKICEAACRGASDFGNHDFYPNSRFETTGTGISSDVCDNCRRLLAGTDGFCPICARQDGMFAQQQPFLSHGTIYHFDGVKQKCKRTVDPSEGIELYPENTFSYNHFINLDANCSDEAFRQSPDCQGLDYSLHMPRDGIPVSLGVVRTHLSHGHDIALDMHDRARSLAAGGLHPCPHTASMLHFFQNKVPDNLVKLNEESELTLLGTKLLQHKLSVDYNITPNNFLEFLNHHGFRVTGNGICRGRRKRCGGCAKFRSFDGSCNNVAHPTWGQSNRAFARILPARYSDGIHGMPVSVTGADLPNPRKLSVSLYSRSSDLDPELTLAVMQWGQTLAHDLGRQVMDQTTNGGIECCADNGRRHLPKSLQHHSCAPITISPTDKFYSLHGQRCMNFVRAMTVTREDCTLGPADQLNGVTSFLDCSPMYGVDKATSDELREFAGGRMKLEFRSGRWMLPTITNRSIFCDIWTSDDVCYRTGDPRNNQNPQLVVLQTMLVREHNRIADGLTALNPEWNDERVFQESRRIVIAEYQHITYNEWLPLLLGKRYVRKHGLLRTEPRMSTDYNERVDPTTIIGFTSGAFRSLHSMVEGAIGLCNVEGDITEKLRLSDHYLRPRVIEKNNNFEHLLRGLHTQRMQMQDMKLHGELTEYLFCSRNEYGMDLAAIDIQRGRDHGVPSYNAYRKICRLEPANDFDDLSAEISWKNIEKLRRDYAHVDDIDLIVGANMENRAPGSHFGPTNRCLIGEQFYRSRVGDRYFYDNANLPHSFTPEQFHEITKVTLSRLMCDMGGAVVTVQRNAFRAISSMNPPVPCEELPKLDLSMWKE